MACCGEAAGIGLGTGALGTLFCCWAGFLGPSPATAGVAQLLSLLLLLELLSLQLFLLLLFQLLEILIQLLLLLLLLLLALACSPRPLASKLEAVL